MTTPILVGYQYPDADVAKAVFDAAEQTGKNCSVYRTCTPDHADWFVIGAFDSYDDLQRIDWKDGEPIGLDQQQREWLIGRRESAKLLAASGAITNRQVIHHAEGVRMPGGSTGAERDAAAQVAASTLAATANAWLARNHSDGGVCDFCCHLLAGRDCATYVLDSPIVSVVVIGGSASVYDVNDPYWGCCPDCDPIIAAGDPAALARYVVDHYDTERVGVWVESPEEREKEVARLTGLYERFYARNPQRHEGEYHPE